MNALSIYKLETCFKTKIYLNFTIEIFKIFLIVLFGLSMIALTVRAVNFLDLIVDSGYLYLFISIFTFELTWNIVKFIPLSFLISLSVFILKHSQDNEFIILWTSGVKKLSNCKFIYFYIVYCSNYSFIIFDFLTPSLLNKSRSILNDNNFNSFFTYSKSSSNLMTFQWI